MGKIFDEPKYPVVDRAPSFWRTVGNFNLRDWSIFGGATALSYPFGYAVGAAPSPAYARVSGNLGHSSAVVASMIGALAGFMLAYQNSTGRLQGFLPNDEEAAEARS